MTLADRLDELVSFGTGVDRATADRTLAVCRRLAEAFDYKLSPPDVWLHAAYAVELRWEFFDEYPWDLV